MTEKIYNYKFGDRVRVKVAHDMCGDPIDSDEVHGIWFAWNQFGEAVVRKHGNPRNPELLVQLSDVEPWKQ